MYNHKHKKTGNVISYSCFKKLKPRQQAQFFETRQAATHSYSDSSDDDAIVFDLLSTAFSDSGNDGDISSDSGGSDPSSDFGGFGDGDTGGGGAGGDF